MLSFELKGGEAELVTFLAQLSVFSVAESLGVVESLVTVPATMTHIVMNPEAGVKDTLIRLFVGIEYADYLVTNIKAGLTAASAARC